MFDKSLKKDVVRRFHPIQPIRVNIQKYRAEQKYNAEQKYDAEQKYNAEQKCNAGANRKYAVKFPLLTI